VTEIHYDGRILTRSLDAVILVSVVRDGATDLVPRDIDAAGCIGATRVLARIFNGWNRQGLKIAVRGIYTGRIA